ncbi:hypothetical protein B0H10DRAFT_1975231 [Mycena sp. CBHHK59/15]|nr:hypothetical protein B0H10DRAFT_1975231 [Mycena sp. CBHHK59/15]
MKRVSEVDNPLASPGKSTGPTTRFDFIETTSKKDQKKKSLPAPGPAQTSASVSGKISYLRVTNSTKPRNLCLRDYIKANGRVTKVVFDAYMANLSPAELKVISIDSESVGDTAFGHDSASRQSQPV